MTDQVTEVASAKINLGLHITGRRPDGYHLLDSMVAFAGVCDRLTLSTADDFSLKITGPMAGGLSADQSNLVLQAAQALRDAFPDKIGGATMVLEKNLPVASGIGGGSADAAAALRGMISLYNGQNIPVDGIFRIALLLGADVPVCVRSAPARMRGIGEILEAVKGLPACPMVLVNPGVQVPTKEVFRRLGGNFSAPFALHNMPQFETPGELCAWLARMENDLQRPAISMAPEIQTVLDELAGAKGLLLARMSGSGATCFGLFGSAAEARSAADTISKAHPGWWVAATELQESV